ncbi:MAG TPA: ribose-5-phosphate isomerase RpiA [Thermoanaerobaculia bacterium]|nr:ribose-5-phosphate isomerase RpiA [Thermoanaerobaculia bacterium]
MGSDSRALKLEAARAALREVRSGMSLGLGTGSTAEEFVRLLGKAIASGSIAGIRGVCTSARTEELARSLGIAVASLAELAPLDLAVDGADEIDPRLRLIKGRGGALLREKIVEQASRRFIVVADHGKLVERLGEGPLPVEVIPLAVDVLRRRFADAGLEPELRKSGGNPFMTDEGNRILDVRVPADRDVAEVVDEMRRWAGVVDTGFFPTEATEALIASPGGVERRERPPAFSSTDRPSPR